eukprot:SAG31_NODE_13_length_37961_cov_21.751307_29_plen_38_part_00
MTEFGWHVGRGRIAERLDPTDDPLVRTWRAIHARLGG